MSKQLAGLLEQIIVHPLKQLFSIRGTAAHSGSVVMQVLAISSVTKGHLAIHRRNSVPIKGPGFILFLT